jgi:hypothetical protein
MSPSTEGTIKMRTTTAEDIKKVTTEKTLSKEWKSSKVVCDLGKMMTTMNKRN